ncbi:hypothetical protein CEXT_791371 [Caerostris extrusa]|uniref:Uncharacterized protein n=1 Tax=Caerostris extrusa TaxID=172846 RepID=A0AAV4M5H0_CAEEX|nr:hypothetical protein CEXT_791371 [Caerostris extrusa]
MSQRTSIAKIFISNTIPAGSISYIISQKNVHSQGFHIQDHFCQIHIHIQHSVRGQDQQKVQEVHLVEKRRVELPPGVRIVGDHVDSSRILVGGSWLVGLDLSSESGTVSDVVDLSGDALVVGETVVSYNYSGTVSGFFSVLFTVVVLDGVSELVGLGLMNLQKRKID